MFCPRCGTRNLPGTSVCNRCQQPLPELSAAEAPAAMQKEEVIWEGSPSWKYHLNGWWIVSFLLVVPILVFLVVVWIKQKSLHYRITTERITITKGFFSRASEDVKLVRVEDLRFEQGFFQRMLGTGHIVVVSTDKTEPNLFLLGVPDPPVFKETLWKTVREARSTINYMEQLNQ